MEGGKKWKGENGEAYGLSEIFEEDGVEDLPIDFVFSGKLRERERGSGKKRKRERKRKRKREEKKKREKYVGTPPLNTSRVFDLFGEFSDVLLLFHLRDNNIQPHHNFSERGPLSKINK